MLHLLMLLICSRGEGVSGRIRLLEQLYGDSDTEQAANSLRAMIFRLRKSLIAAGLPMAILYLPMAAYTCEKWIM